MRDYHKSVPMELRLLMNMASRWNDINCAITRYLIDQVAFDLTDNGFEDFKKDNGFTTRFLMGHGEEDNQTRMNLFIAIVNMLKRAILLKRAFIARRSSTRPTETKRVTSYHDYRPDARSVRSSCYLRPYCHTRRPIPPYRNRGKRIQGEHRGHAGGGTSHHGWERGVPRYVCSILGIFDQAAAKSSRCLDPTASRLAKD